MQNSVNKINDGGRSYGSSSLAIKKFNGTTYVARGTYLSDDFGFTVAMNSREFTDSDDIPTGQVSTRGLVTGRATLQFATSTTAQVEIGDAFKWQDPADSTFLYFYVDSAERAERKGDEAKQSVSFRRALNPTTFKVTAPGGSEQTVDLTAVT